MFIEKLFGKFSKIFFNCHALKFNLLLAELVENFFWWMEGGGGMYLINRVIIKKMINVNMLILY